MSARTELYQFIISGGVLVFCLSQVALRVQHMTDVLPVITMILGHYLGRHFPAPQEQEQEKA